MFAALTVQTMLGAKKEGQGDQAREVLCMVWLLEGSGKLAVTRSDEQEETQPKASMVLTNNEATVLKNTLQLHFQLPVS